MFAFFCNDDTVGFILFSITVIKLLRGISPQSNDPGKPVEIVLRSSDFNSDKGDWFFWTNEKGEGNLEIKDGLARIAITNPGKQPWHVGISSNQLNIVSGITYEVQFKMKSESERRITSRVILNEPPWTEYSKNEVRSISPKMKEYSYTFTMHSPTDKNASLQFQLGDQGIGTVYIDQVSIKQIGGQIQAEKERETDTLIFHNKPTKTRIIHDNWHKDKNLSDYENFFNPENVHIFEATISKSGFETMLEDMIAFAKKHPVTWWDPEKSGYKLYNYKVNRYYKADLVYRGVLGKMEIKDIGFRTKGSYWSRRLPYDPEKQQFQRTHFKVKFNKTFDLEKGSEEYMKLRKRRLASLKEIGLRAVLNHAPYYYADITQIKEMYAHNLYTRAGVISGKAAKIKLYLTIDGVTHDFGLFTAVEPIDKQFLTNNFGKDGNDGNLYKCTWGATRASLSLESSKPEGAFGLRNWKKSYAPTYDLKTNKRNPDYSDIKNFIHNINTLTRGDFVTYIDENLNLEQFLKAMALELLLGNPDGYWGNGHNYYLYFHNLGKIYFIPSDLNHVLAGNSWDGLLGSQDNCHNLWKGWEIIANADIFHYIRTKDRQVPPRPLVEKIFTIKKYRDQYVKYLEELIDPDNNLFTYKDFKTRYSTYFRKYKKYVASDLYKKEKMKLDKDIPNCMSIEEYFEKKIQSVQKQIEKYYAANMDE